MKHFILIFPHFMKIDLEKCRYPYLLLITGNTLFPSNDLEKESKSPLTAKVRGTNTDQTCNLQNAPSVK